VAKRVAVPGVEVAGGVEGENPVPLHGDADEGGRVAPDRSAEARNGTLREGNPLAGEEGSRILGGRGTEGTADGRDSGCREEKNAARMARRGGPRASAVPRAPGGGGVSGSPAGCGAHGRSRHSTRKRTPWARGSSVPQLIVQVWRRM
jgi:hypothetical protein